MIDYVDDKVRALLEVSISNNLTGNYVPVTTWIDTAFDGHLVFSTALIEELGLTSVITAPRRMIIYLTTPSVARIL